MNHLQRYRHVRAHFVASATHRALDGPRSHDL